MLTLLWMYTLCAASAFLHNNFQTTELYSCQDLSSAINRMNNAQSFFLLVLKFCLCFTFLSPLPSCITHKRVNLAHIRYLTWFISLWVIRGLYLEWVLVLLFISITLCRPTQTQVHCNLEYYLHFLSLYP